MVVLRGLEGARVICRFCCQCFSEPFVRRVTPAETQMLRRPLAATCMVDRGSTARSEEAQQVQMRLLGIQDGDLGVTNSQEAREYG